MIELLTTRGLHSRPRLFEGDLQPENNEVIPKNRVVQGTIAFVLPSRAFARKEKSQSDQIVTIAYARSHLLYVLFGDTAE